MFTCSHCTYRHPFEWSLKEHMYVKHNDSSNLNINSTILGPPTKIYAGQNGAIRIPTTVSIPPIRRKAARQSGRGVEYEDTDSEHDDTDEETMDYSVHEEHNHSSNENTANENEDTDSVHGDTDEETMDDSEHEEHNHSDNENIGNENEDTNSEHSDTDEEMLYNEDTDEDTDMDVDNEEHNHSDDTEEDTDMDVDNDNNFHLLHIINDTRSIFEYCIKLRKEYRNALKQFNNLNEEDTRTVIKSYAKLEVIVKDDQFGIENDNNNNFHLLHIINDTQSIFEYCIKLRKEYRKALKQLNDLDEYDARAVLKSYAKLEVIVKDDQFGIENENINNESDDDFWDFVFEFRDILEEDTKLLENYVAVEKEIILSKKDIDKDVPMMGLKEIINNGINLMTDYQKHGEECFETCSNAQIHSVGGMIESFNDPETTVKIRNFNPHKYDLIRDLMGPYIKSIEKIGNSDITIHEKRKTLQKTHVGETVINLITNVILPYLKQLK